MNMKKVFSFIMGLVAMTSLQAANTEVARLTLTGQGGTEASYITLRVDPDVTTAQTGAYFENTDLTGNVNIYVLDGATKLSSYKKDDLTNLHLGILTNRRDAADQHYTITFNVPTSTVGLKLYDLAVDPTTPIDITNGDTYEFEVNTTLHPDFVAGTNYTINDRFVINYVAPSYVTTVETNAYGLATFSYDQDLVAVEPEVKLYKGAVDGEYLDVDQVNYVKANEGVIVYGEANTTYHFAVGNGTSDFSDNQLIAASAWAYPYANKDVYVLSGNMLHLYEGDVMKPNKAFLLLAKSSANPAPKHISMRFKTATGVENVQGEDTQCTKFMENGQVFIRRGNEVYNLQGQIVK